ncbi:MAG: tyrosine-type recombinase/integrase [Patescibacteria group bacterium]|nr:tyrosine-type recombinase/integrase [Patescibacteria group bacterium]
MEQYEKLFLECLDLRSVSQRTKYDYFRRLKPLANYYSQDPSTLSIQQVKDYFLYLIRVKKLSPKSLKLAYYSIRFFYIHAVGIDSRDFSFYKPKIEYKLPVILTRSEVKQILSQIKTEDYKMILNVTYQCGLRISETVGIRIADIDRKTLTIRNAKGNKDRAVPLPDRLYQQLKCYWKTHYNRTLLFPKLRSREHSFDRKTTKQHIPIRTVQIAMKKAVQSAKIVKKATCHTLRHSYATHLLEAGVNILNIQHFLGHSSLRSTMIYLHLTTASRERAISIINGIMSDQ